jgi:hypothetical protein
VKNEKVLRKKIYKKDAAAAAQRKLKKIDTERLSTAKQPFVKI